MLYEVITRASESGRNCPFRYAFMRILLVEPQTNAVDCPPEDTGDRHRFDSDHRILAEGLTVEQHLERADLLASYNFV